MDGDSNSAVIAVPVDYSKAFNRMLHSNIITIMSDLKPTIPTCAIRIIKSYLTQRSMCVRFNGAVSSFQKCPGGGPQGGLLTGLLFCLQVRRAGSPCLRAGMELSGFEEGLEGEQEHTTGMDARHGTTSVLEEEQEPAAGMDTRHSTPSGLEEEQEPATGMDARHGTTSGMEGEQEPATWMDARHGTTSGLEGEHEPATWMDARHGTTTGLEGEQEPATGMAGGLAPAAGLDGEHDPTTGMEG